MTFDDKHIYALEAYQCRRLTSVMTRLYSQTRLNGDQMRDLAQAIDAVLHGAVQLEQPWIKTEG